VTVLRSSGGVLVPVGQVSGLGAGQQIYSVRFVGAAGYVVTFRQVDPLYTIDLSDPSAPRVAGKLDLEGYSSYLHPVGNGLLLGIGQDVGAGNEPAGSQLELFDVSDPSVPRLLARTSLGGGSDSQALYDHHAFLYWPPTKLAVLPVQIYPPAVVGPPAPATGAKRSAFGTPTNSPAQFVGAIGLQLTASGIVELGRIVHDPIDGYSSPILRSIVIGKTLFTLSDGGVMASSIDTLARQAFAAFPQQSTPTVGATGGAKPPP
jgi:Beta propeller domain